MRIRSKVRVQRAIYQYKVLTLSKALEGDRLFNPPCQFPHQVRIKENLFSFRIRFGLRKTCSVSESGSGFVKENL